MKRCPRCKTDLPLKSFQRNRTAKDGHECWCRVCKNSSNLSRQARYIKDGLCHCGRKPVRGRVKCNFCLERARAWSARNPELKRVLAEKGRRSIKIEVFNAYGGVKCVCAGCEETRLEFLTIDHIDGGGHKHRDKKGRRIGGTAIYHWLKKRGYPKGFRVLCMNCNCSRGFYGYCPHEFETRDKSSSTVPVFENPDAISQKPALVN